MTAETTPAQSTTHPSQLMKLPAELKNAIYRFTLLEPEEIVIETGAVPPPQPGLRQTSREIRKDAINTYNEDHRFRRVR